MTLPTLAQQPWLTTDLANISDDLRSIRRHIYDLIADCFVSSCDHVVRTAGRLASDTPGALGHMARAGQTAVQETCELPVYRRTGVLVLFATGFVLALWLGRSVEVLTDAPPSTRRKAFFGHQSIKKFGLS